MKVLKFGGTSVGSPEMLRRVLDVVQDANKQNGLIIVVSAFGGITNTLEELAIHAVKGEADKEEIDDLHPAWVLDGMDNLVLIYSARYAEQPLVIKGAGAGPHVTASGVLADILRIVNG